MQVGNLKNRRMNGFTLIEILVVIVVIAILAAISIVAYNGTQGRARDSRRQNDISEIAKALEVYYSVNHKYPTSGGAAFDSNWSSTSDSSWSSFVTTLKPYMDNNVPSDPISTSSANVLSAAGYNYAYFSNNSTATCGAGANQMYMLVYRLEVMSQTNSLNGACSSTVLNPYANVSNYRVTRL